MKYISVCNVPFVALLFLISLPISAKADPNYKCNKDMTNTPCVVDPNTTSQSDNSNNKSPTNPEASGSTSSDDDAATETIVLENGTQITATAGSTFFVRKDPSTGKFLVGVSQ
jgi:hypothetical protein